MKHRLLPCLVCLTMLLFLAGWVFADRADLLSEARIPPAGRACTSFCLDNDGRAVFGTNYDNDIWEGMVFVNKRGVTKTGWEAGTTGKYARWTSEYGSVTFNLAGIEMVWAGMNEAGLNISTMWLPKTQDPTPDERPPLGSSLWVQYQLDTCAILEEVMANDARVRISETVDHYLVCDRTGACAAVEFLSGKTIWHTAGDMPVKALTNHAYPDAARAWQSGRLSGNALERFGIAADRVTSFQPDGGQEAVAYAFETLKQASGQATGGAPTQWSIVFDTDGLHVHFVTSHNQEMRYLDFADLDFDCGPRAEMLDVHAPLSGDVHQALESYSFEDNLRHTLHFIDKWEGDFPPLLVEVLERGFQSFPCEQRAAPYQEESKRLIPPVVGWAVLALLYRIWPLGIVLGLGIVAVVVWRQMARRR
jgi:penicillin V acylase-like amidase (Ntn superfamily)